MQCRESHDNTWSLKFQDRLPFSSESLAWHASFVDFGANTAGILSIEFEAVEGVEGDEDGLPGLRLASSKTIQRLSGEGDFTRSFNVSPSPVIIPYKKLI